MFAGRSRFMLASSAGLAAVLAGACSPDEPLATPDAPTRGAPAEVAGALWDTLSIPIGGTAVLADAGLSVTFVDVPSDGRCPTRPRPGFACFWEGTAQVTLEIASRGSSERFGLWTFFSEPSSATFGDFIVDLLELAPEPLADPLDPTSTAYVATVIVRPR